MRLRNMDLPTFVEYIKDKEILCFGAGKLLNKLCNAVSIEPYVKAVFDNDKNKHNKKLNFPTTKIKLIT